MLTILLHSKHGLKVISCHVAVSS